MGLLDKVDNLDDKKTAKPVPKKATPKKAKPKKRHRGKQHLNLLRLRKKSHQKLRKFVQQDFLKVMN